MLTSGWFWLGVVVTIFLVTGGRESISVRKRRRRHVLGHPPVTDEQFLAELGVADNDADKCLAFRQAFVEAGRVPAETVHASDRIADLGMLGWDGMDWLDIIFRTEKKLGIGIEYKAADKALRGEWVDRDMKEMTLGDYLRCCMRHWQDIVVE